MGLPDERSRGSVANLIGRFEKQTRPSDASLAPSTPPKVVVPNKIPPPARNPTEPSGPALSWVKKKDTLPPSSPKDKDSVKIAANDADAQPTVSAPEPAPVETTTVAEPETVPTVDLSQDKGDEPSAAKVAPTEKPALETATAESKEEPSNAPAPSMAAQRKLDHVPKAARPGTGGSKAPNAASAGPSQSVAKASKTGASPSKPVRSAKSSLNESKSTPALKKGPEAASATPSRPNTAKAKDTNPPAQPLRPQHTGASVASNSRRVVTSTTSASGTKTPATSGGPPLVKPQPTRPVKVPQSSTLYAPTAATLARQRKEESGPPPSAGKKAAALTTIRPRAGSTSGTSSGFRPLQLPLKSSVSASGSTRRMVSVSREPKAGAEDGAIPASPAVPAPRDRSPAKRTPLKPFPTRSPTRSPLSKAQIGGNARISKHAAVGAWAGDVAAAGPEVVTSEQELILGGEKTAPEGSGIEIAKDVTPEAQQLDAITTEPADVAASSGLGKVMPDESGPGDTVDHTLAEPEEQEEAKAGHHTDIEDTAAAPSTEDEPTTPEPQAAVPIAGDTSANTDGPEHRQQPEQDELEQMVSMLEAPRKTLHFGASSDEDEEDPAPLRLKKIEGSIPDIPDDV